MATSNGTKLTALGTTLKNTFHWQFVQLLRLLENAGELKNFLLTADARLSFPATDVTGVDSELGHIVCRFMGLFGVDAPLPHYFLFEASRQTTSAEILRAFLNIFNHRLYELLYAAWKKFQPVILAEQQQKSYDQYLIALSGRELQSEDGHEFAGVGLLGKRVRSASGLSAVLQNFLASTFMGEDGSPPIIEVKIEQFIPRWACVQTTYLIGQGYCLAENTLLGERVLDLSSLINVSIGTLTLSQALALLPGLLDGQRLRRLIACYIEPCLHYRIRIIVMPDSTAALHLGLPQLQLGRHTWLGRLTGNSFILMM